MARNSAKMNWTLEELGWKLLPPGDVREWDGMMRWLLEYTEKHPQTIIDNAVRRWVVAAKRVLSGA
jgi:hypothetical protein